MNTPVCQWWGERVGLGAHTIPLPGTGIIEGSHAWMGFAAGVILLLASAVSRWVVPRRHKSTPMLVFTVTLALTLPLGELLYYLAVGSFAQPSELGTASPAGAQPLLPGEGSTPDLGGLIGCCDGDMCVACVGGTSAMAELILMRARRMFAAIGTHVV